MKLSLKISLELLQIDLRAHNSHNVSCMGTSFFAVMSRLCRSAHMPIPIIKIELEVESTAGIAARAPSGPDLPS